MKGVEASIIILLFHLCHHSDFPKHREKGQPHVVPRYPPTKQRGRPRVWTPKKQTLRQRKRLISRNSLEEGRRVKKPRAPVSLDIDPSEPDQQLERNNLNPQSSIPPGFLSPSVKEYLELGKSIPGRPGADYPVLGEVPYTNFYCENQDWPGFFADVDTRCQAWHYCDIDGRQATFLCPNGTQFSQAVFVCDWWFNVRCDLSTQLYSINSRLYQRPALDPTRPHRKITKELLENIFV